MATDPEEDGENFDIALLGGQTEDGAGRRVVRLRPDGATVGEIRPLQEGRPIHGEVVQLKPRQEAPWVCDVDVNVPAARPAASAAPASPPRPAELPREAQAPRHGPAQVATEDYRANWDRIFGGKKAPGGDVN